MSNVPNGVKILRKISIAWTLQTDDRQTDGRRHTANAKKCRT